MPSNEQMADILDEEEAMEIGKPKDEKELEALEELQKEKEAQSREQVLEFVRFPH